MHAEVSGTRLLEKGTKFEVILLIFIILDLSSFPVSPLYSLPFSILAILYFSLRFLRSKTFNRPFILMTLVSTLVLSTLFSFLGKESLAFLNNNITTSYIGVQKEDLRRLIYFLISLAIYKSVYSLNLKHNLLAYKSIKYTLMIVIGLFLLFGVIFLMDMSFFYSIKNIFFNSDVDLSNNLILLNSGYLNRFNFILLDPNNAAYFALMIIFFIKENFRLNKFENCFFIIVMFSTVILTKSSGGVYSLLIYLLINFVVAFKPKVKLKSLILWYLTIIIFTLIFVIDIYSNNYILNFIFNSSTFQRLSSNSLGGRSEIYMSILNTLPPIFGNGYTFIKNGEYVLPHSDHLRFLYSYGIVSYISLILLFINKRYFSLKYLFLIPAFIAFSINSLIDETRLLYTFIILLSLANSSVNRERLAIINQEDISY